MARAGGRPQPTITDDRALSSAKIERSLRFNSSDTSVLYRTPSSASNRQTWTFSTYFLFPSGSSPIIPTTSGTISMISFTVHRQGVVGLATQLLAGASVNFS